MKTLLDDLSNFYLPDFIGKLIDDITPYFVFNPDHRLLFNSAFFLGFFLVVYTVYVLSKNHDTFRKIYLIVFSLYFYYLAGGDTMDINLFGYYFSLNYFVLLVICAVATHLLAVRMYNSERQSTQKAYLILIIVGNLLMLAYFKYTNFLIDNINAIFHGDLSFQNIILPIGISFFVFEAISYAVDLYRREMKPADSLLDFCFYIAFFPKLVAGPIIRAKDFLPQMKNKLGLTKEEFGMAMFLILIGLIKKAIISDYISVNFVDRVFDSPMSYTSFENLMAVYGYTLQIYCDFSGYSDMAIGLSLLMGFKIPPNFLTPYKSQSITEFWRRWHISLSSWLRDYLYISMGGNRKGKFRTYFNLFMTMLIGGLWHGASWKFVIWGGLHGLLLVVERFFKQFIKVPDNRLTRIICILLTFHFVAFCWIFFRAGSFELAGNVISNIGQLTFAPNEWWAILEGYQNVFILVVIGYVMHFLPENFVNKLKAGFISTPLFVKALIAGLIFWMIFATASSGPQPFIYFQF
ncbi:MBOAT family protein [Dysgonomonas sp. 511]|uniref:MBOAT family O-acyltransferase n=1 Tax=Dysgonomonas sp. 511 TaxID=2302930 RepID=UPI0013D37D83|nr:MBOAT family protein [Dysgonomonas sp. 511]NDV78299.1 MBOAT family protein [Dysgonomonas sp. 511]